MTQQQPPAPPAQQQPPGTGGQQGGDPETNRVQALDQRFKAIEDTQAEQGGMLKTIIDRLPGGTPTQAAAGAAPAAGAGSAPTGPAVGDIQAQVRSEIEAADRRRQADAQAADEQNWKTGVNEQLERLKPENQPRGTAPGVKGKLQRAFFGID